MVRTVRESAVEDVPVQVDVQRDRQHTEFDASAAGGDGSSTQVGDRVL
jgi:hypothetical protein